MGKKFCVGKISSLTIFQFGIYLKSSQKTSWDNHTINLTWKVDFRKNVRKNRNEYMLTKLYPRKVYIEMYSSIYLNWIYLKSTYSKKLSKWYFVPSKEQIVKYPYNHIHTLKNWVMLLLCSVRTSAQTIYWGIIFSSKV